MNVNRKQFLMLGGAGGLALAGLPLGLWVRERALDRAVPDEVLQELRNFFADQPGAMEVGRVYLKEHPDLNDDRNLARRILEKTAEPSGKSQSSDLAPRLLAAHRADWDAAEPVLVAGWAVTETEALLCSLAALSAG